MHISLFLFRRTTYDAVVVAVASTPCHPIPSNVYFRLLLKRRIRVFRPLTCTSDPSQFSYFPHGDDWPGLEADWPVPNADSLPLVQL